MGIHKITMMSMFWPIIFWKLPMSYTVIIFLAAPIIPLSNNIYTKAKFGTVGFQKAYSNRQNKANHLYSRQK